MSSTKKSANSSLTIDCNHYTSQFRSIQGDLHYFSRNHKFSQSTKVIDALGPAWHLITTQLAENQVVVSQGLEERGVSGSIAIFLPPFSLIQWQVSPGNIHWESYGGEQSFSEMPTQPVLFQPDTPFLVESYDDLTKILIAARKLPSYQPLFTYPVPHVAEQTKGFIDRSFDQEISMPEISKRLRIPHSTMTHGFKSTFGISPYKYRNQLRVFTALHQMLVNCNSVTDSCFKAGFSDLYSFQRNFRKTLGERPSLFSRKKGTPIKGAEC